MSAPVAVGRVIYPLCLEKNWFVGCACISQERKHMTYNNNNVAPSAEDEIACWNELNWQKIRRKVMSFQRRIVKAYHEGNNDKLAALEYLVTNSFSAKALAVRLVTEAKGSRTAGVDRQRWVTAGQKYKAILHLKTDKYAPSPYLRVNILKTNGKPRPLSIPTLSDRAVQTLYKFYLEPIAECGADINSFGYRRWRSTLDAIKECYRVLCGGAQWVIEGDIAGCFDNISHDWLLANIPMDQANLRKILKCGYQEHRGSSIEPSVAGVAQGGPLSSILCNMALDGMRSVIKLQSTDLEMIRYADDFIIAANDLKTLCSVWHAVDSFLQERGLYLSSNKTAITSVSHGFDFFGYRFINENGTVKMEPSKKSVCRVLTALHSDIKNHALFSDAEMANRINGIIRGWVNYHQYCTERRAFLYIDIMVSRFLAGYGARPGIQEALITASETICQPLVSVRMEANPFDADWRLYFEEWAHAKRFYTTRGYNKLASAFMKQDGMCTLCGNRIESDFSIHEKHSRHGKMVELTHPECHTKIHQK